LTESDVGPHAPQVKIDASLLALTALLGCGSSGDDYDTFVDRYAQAVCHRAFSCCRPADLMRVHQTGDEASCAAGAAMRGHQEAAELLRYGLVRFDANAGKKCLDLLASAGCGQLFGAKYGTLDGCPNFLPGTTPLGGACDDDFVCESNWCVSQSCRPRPCAAGCPAGQVCDGESSCIAATPLGGTCSALTGACTAGTVCLDQQCASPRAEGASCKHVDDCAGTCDLSPTTDPSATGTCRPGLCQGL
jgi:hypothetical protein